MSSRENSKALPGPKSAISELVDRLRWVIGIRWTIAVALLLVGLFGPFLGRGDLRGSSVVHIALALIVAAYNIFYLFATRRPDFGQTPFTSFLRIIQIPVDLAVFTAIVHFSGGVTGPVFVLYFLYIFVGLTILPPSGAYVVAGLAAFCYGALALIEALWLKPPPGPPLTGTDSVPTSNLTYLGYFLTVSAMLIIIAYIANYFAGLLTQDERTIRKQLNEINMLHSFTREMSKVLTSDDAVQMLVEKATEIENSDACSLLLFNDNGEAMFAATRGVVDGARYRGKPLPIDHLLVHMLLTKGQGIYAPNVDAVDGLRSVLLRPSTVSFYAIPMMNDDRLMGSLNLSFDKPYVMSDRRWQLLGAMTQQAAMAVERARLLGHAQRAAKEMTSLYHIGLATTSSLQIDEVLDLIYKQVRRVLHLDTFYIAMYDEERSELRYELFIEDGKVLPPFTAKLDSAGISSWIVRNRKPVFIKSWSQETEQLPFEAGTLGAATESAISVPLIAKNKIVGVMSVQALERNAFDANHLRLLTSIASQAALALENARLHTTVNEQAQRDPLTGVYHHGRFIDKLRATLDQALRQGETVGLIMLDIDRFKQYNDTYGHLVGDDVLRCTVRAIEDNLKSTDIVGRWGGEEFGVVLPGVSRTQARLIADRIRETVANNILQDRQGRSIPSPTVSQGIALYPEDAQELEELIDKADSALFRAKDLGRNRISEWIEMNGPFPLKMLAK